MWVLWTWRWCRGITGSRCAAISWLSSSSGPALGLAAFVLQRRGLSSALRVSVLPGRWDWGCGAKGDGVGPARSSAVSGSRSGCIQCGRLVSKRTVWLSGSWRSWGCVRALGAGGVGLPHLASYCYPCSLTNFKVPVFGIRGCFTAWREELGHSVRGCLGISGAEFGHLGLRVSRLARWVQC